MLQILWIILFLTGTSIAIDLEGCDEETKIFDVLEEGLEGDIYSPGYKEGVNYLNNLICMYQINAPEGYNIKLRFVDFDVETSDLCRADQLMIFGSGQSDTENGEYCGNNTYSDIVFMENSVNLIFQTDFFYNRRGFHLRYTASSTIKPCEDNQKLCRNNKCFNTTSTCNGKDDCGDGTDEENCEYPLPTTICGKRLHDDSTESSTDRIIGGREAIPGSWPWQVSLQTATIHPSGHLCGGTLINAQWVLTASHCFFQSQSEQDWRLHFGKHRKFKKDYYEQVRYAKQIIVYPDSTLRNISDFNYNLTHDMALVKLNAPVYLNDQVRPACLPKDNFDLKIGTTCTMTGWGVTRGSGSNTALKEIELTIAENPLCNSDVLGPSNNKTQICTASQKSNHDACHGDSGGPLVCKINGEWQLMGATSYGTRINFEKGLCGLPGTNTVFSKVPAKVGWVRKIIGMNL